MIRRRKRSKKRVFKKQVQRNKKKCKFIYLDFVESSRILVSDKFKYSENGSKFFIGYLHDDNVIRPLCIVLPQMSGYIKYFDNDKKDMSFLIEYESVYLKYTETWNKLKSC